MKSFQIELHSTQYAGINVQLPQSATTPRRLTLPWTLTLTKTLLIGLELFWIFRSVSNTEHMS